MKNWCDEIAMSLTLRRKVFRSAIEIDARTQRKRLKFNLNWEKGIETIGRSTIVPNQVFSIQITTEEFIYVWTWVSFERHSIWFHCWCHRESDRVSIWHSESPFTDTTSSSVSYHMVMHTFYLCERRNMERVLPGNSISSFWCSTWECCFICFFQPVH